MISGWLERHPLVVPVLAGAACLGLAQAVLQLSQVQSPGAGGFAIALGIAQFSILVGFVTMIILVPPMLLARRLLPSWRRGERHAASWTITFTCVAALIGWMLADLWSSGPWIPEPVRPWFALAVAILFGFAAAWMRRGWRRSWTIRPVSTARS